MSKILFVALALVGSIVAAQADTLHFSGSGLYATEPTNPDSPPNTNTLYSTPGGTWSFQFDVTAPLGSNPVTVTNFSFFNNSVLVADPLKRVSFADGIDGGLFGLSFNGGSVNFFGDPVGGPFGELNGPSVSPPYPIVLGTYDVAGLFALSGDGFSEGGSGTIQISAVPGPMVGAGIPGLVMAFGGLLAWRRSRRVLTLSLP